MSVFAELRAPSPKKFLAAFALVAASAVGATAALTIGIDPYGIWKLVDIHGIATRPAQEGHDRMVKAHLIAREKPNALFVGTSRTQVMIDPKHPSLAKLDAVNAGVNAGQPYDHLRLFQHAHHYRKQELLVVGLSMLAFDLGQTRNTEFSEDRFAVTVDGRPNFFPRARDIPAAALSVDALKAALGTFKNRNKGRPAYLEDTGQRSAAYQLASMHKAGGVRELFLESERDYLGNYSCAHPYEVKRRKAKAAEPFKDFERLLDEAARAGTKVKLYFPPQHARHLEVVAQAGQLEVFERWRADLARIAKQKNVELYDFTTLEWDEPVPPAGTKDAAPLRYWWESSHANAALGARVLELLLTTDPPHEIQPVAPKKALWDADHVAEKEEIRLLAEKVLPGARKERGCD